MFRPSWGEPLFGSWPWTLVHYFGGFTINLRGSSQQPDRQVRQRRLTCCEGNTERTRVGHHSDPKAFDASGGKSDDEVGTTQGFVLTRRCWPPVCPLAMEGPDGEGVLTCSWNIPRITMHMGRNGFENCFPSLRPEVGSPRFKKKTGQSLPLSIEWYHHYAVVWFGRREKGKRHDYMTILPLAIDSVQCEGSWRVRVSFCPGHSGLISSGGRGWLTVRKGGYQASF